MRQCHGFPSPSRFNKSNFFGGESTTPLPCSLVLFMAETVCSSISFSTPADFWVEFWMPIACAKTFEGPVSYQYAGNSLNGSNPSILSCSDNCRNVQSSWNLPFPTSRNAPCPMQKESVLPSNPEGRWKQVKLASESGSQYEATCE